MKLTDIRCFCVRLARMSHSGTLRTFCFNLNFIDYCKQCWSRHNLKTSLLNLDQLEGDGEVMVLQHRLVVVHQGQLRP